MQVLRPMSGAAPSYDADERSLLLRLEQLLDLEETALAARDPIAIATVAEERERVTARLGDAARLRRADASLSADEESGLKALYERVRQRHDVRARIVRRHAERNARAIGVLAQATGQPALYRSDGRVALQYGSRSPIPVP